MNSEPLTVKEAAAYLKRSEWKIYEMVRQKKIPHFRIGSGISFRKESLDAWIAKQEAANCQEVVVNEVQVERPVIKASVRVFGSRPSKLSRIGN